MNEPEIEQINREIEGKFRRIEAEIAACRSAVDLFETLLAAMGGAFAIPFPWLSIVRSPETERLLGELGRSEVLSGRLKAVDDGCFQEALADQVAPLLADRDLRPFFRLMPPHRKFFIRSIAVVQLSFRGRLIGSLNLGDPSPDRFRPGMETSLLRGLAARVSERLDALAAAEEGTDPAAGP